MVIWKLGRAPVLSIRAEIESGAAVLIVSYYYIVSIARGGDEMDGRGDALRKQRRACCCSKKMVQAKGLWAMQIAQAAGGGRYEEAGMGIVAF